MTPFQEETPASVRTESERHDFEQLGGRLESHASATNDPAQLAQHDFAIVQCAHLSELGDLLAHAGDLLVEAARRGSDKAVEAALRAARAIIVDAIACFRGRGG